MKSVLASVALLLLLSGCAGSAGTKALPGPPSARFGAETGGVEGLVLDPELAPVPGAFIQVLGTNVTVNTTQDGRFAISDLAPQTYLAVITKSGYAEKKHGFEVPLGNVSQERIILEPIPPPVPYVDQGIMHSGFVRLGYAYQVATARGNSSGNQGVAMPEQVRASQPYHLLVEKHWQTILLEVEWTPASAQFDELALQVTWAEKTSSGATSLSNKVWVTGGDGPLRWRLERPAYDAMVAENKALFAGLGYGLPVLVTPATDPTQPVDGGVYPEQSYRIYVSIGYNGPIPTGHTRLASEP